jgi:arylsulfatase A-like enzyme
MDRPNIVVILADDTGYGDVGCYNDDSKIPTPNIDRVAAEGIRLTDAHSPSALCTPTRYGLLTGRYYWRTPKKHSLVMPYEPPVIEPGRPTLATMLRDRGYATACVGKWHLGLLYPSRQGAGERYTQREADIDFTRPLDGGPIELGFDYFFGTAGCSTSDAPYCFIENDRTVGIPSVPSTEDLHALPGFYPGLMTPDWSETEVDATFVDKAVAFVDRHLATRAQRPFFLYHALSAPHIPWLVPEFLRGASAEGSRGDMNALVDWCVGRIRDALDRRGILDDTLLIFTSDNGPQRGANGHSSAGPYRGFKNSAFEGGHREPFVARWPGKIPAGAVCDEPLCLTDMMATLAELTGQPMPDGAGEDSFSVAQALLGRGGCRPPRPAMIADTGGYSAKVADFAIRRGRWKLIVPAPAGEDQMPKRLRSGIEPGSPPLLFDILSDPGERNDLSGQHPSIIADLLDLLEKAKKTGLRDIQA